jgi:phosphatidate cytidylyltransferase
MAATGYAVGAVAHLSVAHISGMTGLIVGSIVGIFCPLGDLGKSLLKRQFNLKSTSDLIPGHGGVLDRIDTWLWAGVISFYLIRAFFFNPFCSKGILEHIGRPGIWHLDRFAKIIS